MYDKFSYIYDELMKRQVDYNLLASNVIQICNDNNINVKSILECGMGRKFSIHGSPSGLI